MSARTQGTASGLTLVGASAGSGKTYRLTEEVNAAVDPKGAHAIEPEQLVAVTYTKRAAAELGARIRTKLVEEGAHDRALKLPLAYLGTVHAVCLRLVQEFAIDAGLSPRVDVLAGDEERWLREALESGLDHDLRRRIDERAARLQLRWNALLDRFDWLQPVQDIMTLARSNRIAPSKLPGMAARSAEGLLALFPAPARDGDALDRALLEALESAAKKLAKFGDHVDKCVTAREFVEDMLRDARRGPLTWDKWAKLAKIDPGKKAQDAVMALVEAASRVEEHPRLHEDLRALTADMFEAARQGLETYDGRKRRRRVVDFVEMIDRALTLLETRAVSDELREQLRLLVVDELQDTSPVQLALFSRIHRIAGRSTWVGDRKQCIFEFAGADPALMEAVTAWAARAGGESQQLGNNWRSRPELVDACSHLFAAAFERHGHKREEVVVKATRTTPRGLAKLPPFGVWTLDTKNAEEDSAAIAEGVRRLLEKPAEMPVIDRVTKEVRDVRPGDVAVLVYTNAEATRLAEALAQRGVRATVARAGLMSTPEGAIVRAAFGVVLDANDTLSAAILDALTGFGGKSADAWLAERLAREKNGASAKAGKIVARLGALRPEVEAMAPSEALDRVMLALDLAALCRRWPDPEQRMGNIDALRSLTAEYEERCARLHEAGTLAGLARYFDEAAEEKLVRDEEIARDDQHVGADANAVTIATYHKAKGLEWPVVALASLDRPEKRNAFDVCPESDRDVFNPDDPLGGRWIRYWPWPFGPQKKVPLAERAQQSSAGLAVAQREARERVRLLYVGFTRARDHLVLATRASKSGPKWLNELCDASGEPLVELPSDEESDERGNIVLRGIDGATMQPAARHWSLGTGGDEPARLDTPPSRAWFAPPKERVVERPPYWISPSRAATDWPQLPVPEVGETVRIGEPVVLGDLNGIERDVLGNAVHAFLAADRPELSTEQRRACAERILEAHGVSAALSVEDLLCVGDRLRTWVESRWPGAKWHREFPITGVIETPAGARRVQGTIDLLLEIADGVVIVDHKSAIGDESGWSRKAREFAPQLAAYERLIEMWGQRVLGTWVHFSIGGGAVRLA